MKFDWDAVKSAANLRKHKIAFDLVFAVDWKSARIFSDDRHDYGEERQVARAMIDGQLYVIVFVLRGDTMRLISFRKANRRERALYGNETAN